MTSTLVKPETSLSNKDIVSEESIPRRIKYYIKIIKLTFKFSVNTNPKRSRGMLFIFFEIVLILRFFKMGRTEEWKIRATSTTPRFTTPPNCYTLWTDFSDFKFEWSDILFNKVSISKHSNPYTKSLTLVFILGLKIWLLICWSILPSGLFLHIFMTSHQPFYTNIIKTRYEKLVRTRKTKILKNHSEIQENHAIRRYF